MYAGNTKLSRRFRCLLSIFLAVALALGGCGFGKKKNTESQQPETQSQETVEERSENSTQKASTEAEKNTKNEEELCLVTINNGASEANNDYAVNGLHVYDPNSEDMDDLVSGVKLKKGSTLSIYVYNLASDVHLMIIHNGIVIVDKDFSVMQAFVDDDKVEFFDITLEGDLVVTTSVSKNGETASGTDKKSDSTAAGNKNSKDKNSKDKKFDVGFSLCHCGISIGEYA